MTVRLETERLVLRLPRPEDAGAVAEYLGDPEVMAFIGGAAAAADDPTAVLERWLRRWQEDGFGHFVAELRSDGSVVGRVGLLCWDTGDPDAWRHVSVAEAGDDGQPELGWTLLREHWGHGYATEGAVAARAWARDELGVGRLISLIDAANTRSQGVARRLGARPEEQISIADYGPVDVWVHPA